MSVHAPVRPPAPVVAPAPAVVPADAEERRRALRGLSHYLEGYPYQPHHAYTETFTTDPHYIREHVDLMPPGDPHSYYLTHLVNAFCELIDRWVRYVSREVEIVNIPGALLVAAPRHTGSQVPDLAVWPFRAPVEEGRKILTYDFQQTPRPLLILEVVSHSTDEVRDNDRVVKCRNYARMGVREYWLLDTEEPETPLEGFRLTQDGVAYTPVSAVYDPYAPVPADVAYASLPAVDDGWRSAVLGTALRWDAESAALQRRDDKRGIWVDVYVPPAVAEARGEARGRRKRDVEYLVRLVRDHGALSPEQLAAYRVQLETRTRLPDAMLVLTRLLGFSDREARTRAVQTFVDTGYMPSPTDNGR